MLLRNLFAPHFGYGGVLLYDTHLCGSGTLYLRVFSTHVSICLYAGVPIYIPIYILYI